jgi:hypothetical protein
VPEEEQIFIPGRKQVIMSGEEQLIPEEEQLFIYPDNGYQYPEKTGTYT